MSGLLELALLGGAQVRCGGVLVQGFVSVKARALLCYLAVTRRTHFRETLATLLWGELPETDAAANLRVTLSKLQRLLPGLLVITRQTVCFNHAQPHSLDVERFEELVRAAEPLLAADAAPLLQACVALYRGDFLEGFHVRDAASFEEWAIAQRERLRELNLWALHGLVAYTISQGTYVQGIEYAGQLLVLDPWHEVAHRQMMLLLALSGQRRAALSQFETCRRTLAEELGVEPTRETRALVERIRAGYLRRTDFMARSVGGNAQPPPEPHLCYDEEGNLLGDYAALVIATQTAEARAVAAEQRVTELAGHVASSRGVMYHAPGR